MGQVVQRGLIANLPLNERNYLNFTLLVPGAHTSGGLITGVHHGTGIGQRERRS